MYTESEIYHAEKNTAVQAVAIVVLSWNQRDTTLRCLHSIVTAGYSPRRIVVWDNGSGDGTEAAVRREFPDIVFGRSEHNLGVASGRNTAAALARDALQPEFLLFLDNDMQVTAGFIEALRSPFDADAGLAQTASKILMLDDTTRINAAGGSDINFVTGAITPVGYGETDHGQYDATRICLPCGGGTMVRASVFFELGGFDAVFDPYGPEDLDFSLRVRAAGYYGSYVPEAVVYHEHARTVSGGSFDAVYTGTKLRHWLVLLRRHASWLQRAGFYLLGAPLGAMRVSIRELLRGNPAALKGIISGVWRHLAGRT